MPLDSCASWSLSTPVYFHLWERFAMASLNWLCRHPRVSKEKAPVWLGQHGLRIQCVIMIRWRWWRHQPVDDLASPFLGHHLEECLSQVVPDDGVPHHLVAEYHQTQVVHIVHVVLLHVHSVLQTKPWFFPDLLFFAHKSWHYPSCYFPVPSSSIPQLSPKVCVCVHHDVCDANIS